VLAAFFLFKKSEPAKPVANAIRQSQEVSLPQTPSIWKPPVDENTRMKELLPGNWFEKRKAGDTS